MIITLLYHISATVPRTLWSARMLDALIVAVLIHCKGRPLRLAARTCVNLQAPPLPPSLLPASSQPPPNQPPPTSLLPASSQPPPSHLPAAYYHRAFHRSDIACACVRNRVSHISCRIAHQLAATVSTAGGRSSKTSWTRSSRRRSGVAPD